MKTILFALALLVGVCLCWPCQSHADCHIWPEYLPVQPPPDPPPATDQNMCDNPTPAGVICSVIQHPQATGEACKMKICFYGEDGQQCVVWRCDALQNVSTGNLDCNASSGTLNNACAPVGVPHVIGCWATACQYAWDIDPVEAIRRGLSSLTVSTSCFTCDCNGPPMGFPPVPLVSCQNCR